MATIARNASTNVDMNTAKLAPHISDLVAGEDLDPAAPCRIDATDGLLYMSDGSANDADAQVDGFACQATKAGEVCTLFGHGVRFQNYGVSLTPGDRFYLAATAGRLEDVATTGGLVPIARALNATDLQVIRDH